MEDNKKIKIQIKSVLGDVLFEYEKENNTVKYTLEEAVRQKVALYGANLYGANLNGATLDRATLYGANLNGANLNGATLDRANLNGATLNGANLNGANLNRATLDRATLNGANLDRATLDGANLYGANLYGATLYGANLNGANLNGANLYGATLNGANLYGANLNRANLNGAKDIPYIPLYCPSDGAFVGWKKVKCCLIKLEIPEDARRSSATTRKCRCDKAKVLDITHLTTNEPITEVTNTAYSPEITYKVGEMVYPDKFDDNRWNECSNGIHFFINKQDAIDY